MEEYNQNAHQQNKGIAIYSKMAVLGFCIFFNPLFGGVLLRANLRSIGKSAEGLSALLFSVLLFLVTAFIASFFQRYPMSSVFISNLAGGAIMVEYFFRKYFPDEEDYPKKSITRPILFSLLIVFVFLFLLLAAGAKLF